MNGQEIQLRSAEVQVHGTFTLNLLPDGRYANLELHFAEPKSERLEEWLRFTYCNDLVWRHHASLGPDQWFSLLRFELYRHLLQHIQGEQYLVPGAK